ncbi:hypothetical protein HQ584_12565 [Patescibacteria group bacterium]|nr:hypothetical protein [Patescibacteria group bacterium]
MANGLILGLDEFRSLPPKRKLDCLYENQCRTLLEIKGYKFHQKIQYPWLMALTTVSIFLIKYSITGQ